MLKYQSGKWTAGKYHNTNRPMRAEYKKEVL